MTLIHLKEFFDKVGLVMTTSDLEEDMHHAPDLVPQECVALDGGAVHLQAWIVSEDLIISWLILAVNGLNGDLEDVANEVLVGYDIHLAEVPEVMRTFKMFACLYNKSYK